MSQRPHRVRGKVLTLDDEKSVPADYILGRWERSILERAHGHARQFVVLRGSRERYESFAAALALVSKGLMVLCLSADLAGEWSRVYRLTAVGEEVARVVAAS